MQAAGLEPMIVAGPADDAAPFSKFQVLRNPPLSALKSLMSGAALFIGNDSGPAHVAAAFGVPVVVLFGASDAVTWAPWRTEARVLTSNGSISEIAVDEVMTAAEALRNSNVKAKA
jgi:heptosyltransferase III